MEVLKASVFHGLATFSGTEVKKPFVGLEHLVEVKLDEKYTHVYNKTKLKSNKNENPI
jgi:hypothetical protein